MLDPRIVLRYGLPCHVAVFTIFQTDASAIQVGDAIGISTVSVGLQSGAVRKIEHTQRLPHHLINDVVVAAVEAGSIKAGKTFIFGERKAFRRCTYRLMRAVCCAGK